jgi:aerobic-type carbon monoxide dehydrogenase small subunit (CoxS/CutS family)
MVRSTPSRRPALSTKSLIHLDVNGKAITTAVRPHDVLLDVLRNDLGYIGTKRGCDQGSCGCCTVHVDGRPTLACLTLARWADGRKVTTIEGVAGTREAHPLQAAFESCGATQCGYCTPGFIMSAKALIEKCPQPDVAAIKEHISGNICRCTGYLQIIEAVQLAADQIAAKERPHDDRAAVEHHRETSRPGR